MKHETLLQRTLWEIERKWGPGAVRTAEEAAPRRAIATGYAALDQALAAGGAAVGHITVIMGIPTSGATTCAYRALACAQQPAAIAAYVDVSASFDPDAAARCGVILPHLLLVRPNTAAVGLAVARDILLTRAFRLLVIDLSGDAATLASTACDRLAETALRSDCAVLLLIDRRLPALYQRAHTWLRFERQAWLKRRGSVVGCRTQVQIEKDKPIVKQAAVTLEIAFEALA